MESKQAFIFSFVLSLALFSFVFCIVADFKRSKEKDLRLDGKLCHLPQSHAFRFGIAALTCLVFAQIIGNLLVLTFCLPSTSLCCLFSSIEVDDDDDERMKVDTTSTRKPATAATLMAFSWLSFGVALLLMSVAASMNNVQEYGKGWLDGKCYLVKDGVFIGAAILFIFSISSTLGSAFLMMQHKQEQSSKRAITSSIEKLSHM